MVLHITIGRCSSLFTRSFLNLASHSFFVRLERATRAVGDEVNRSHAKQTVHPLESFLLYSGKETKYHLRMVFRRAGGGSLLFFFAPSGAILSEFETS